MSPDETARAAWAEITALLGTLDRLRSGPLDTITADALALAACALCVARQRLRRRMEGTGHGG